METKQAQIDRARCGAARLPSQAQRAPVQDAAPAHAACGWCCVHPAGTKMSSVPLWQGCPLVTLLRGWHVAASIPWAGQGSARYGRKRQP